MSVPPWAFIYLFYGVITMYNQDKHMSKLMKKTFSFFAFSNNQFDEQANCNFKYTSLGSGLCVPTVFAEKFIMTFDAIRIKNIEDHQANTSNRDIIWYQLVNYETQFTGDLSCVYDALIDYKGITKEMIDDVYQDYFNHCCENDLF